MDVYRGADAEIKSLNRSSMKEFDRLKLAKWDELHIIREVTEIYDIVVKKAKKRFLALAFDAYFLCLVECGIPPKKARRMAEKTIDARWLQKWLDETDPVTRYRFDPEAERKKQRLIEALGIEQNRDEEIDKALRFWAKQIGQYAIGTVDNARIQAFTDAGVDKVMWMTEHDERVCDVCGPRDRKVYPVGKVPPKPHWGCRCWLVPVKD